MIFTAREMEAEVLSNLKDTPNYTGFSEKNRYFNGFLGELAFEKFLKAYKIKYTYEVKLDGKSQGSDFVIILHRPLQVEIKTSAHPNATQLLIPEKQLNHRSFDMYVGIKLQDTLAKIYGYCFKDELGFKPEGYNSAKIPTYYRDFNKLYPIENLESRRG